MMSLDQETEELLARIRKKCQDRGWFGADEWMDPGFSSPPPFRTTFPPASTKEQLGNVEQQLDFPLPRLLRDLYLHLANGEVCFGYGILPVEQLLQVHQSISERTCFDGAWHWPKRLIPLCYWGDTLYSYLDSERGIILFADLGVLLAGEGDFVVEASSLRAWLDRWVTKQDRFPSLAQQQEDDETGRQGYEDIDDEQDSQARAMGLETLEDDPHTPIPPYVSEYRRLSRR